MFDFARCMDDVFGVEGGISDRKNDLGGHTAFGMTQHTYDRLRVQRNLPKQDVVLATRVELMQLYKEEFWVKAGCDKLISVNKDRIALLQFHISVQRSPDDAVRMLQKLLNIDPQTGFFGNITLNAVSLVLEDSLIYNYLSAMKQHYLDEIKKIPSQIANKHGWMNRLNHIAIMTGSSWHTDINAEV